MTYKNPLLSYSSLLVLLILIFLPSTRIMAESGRTIATLFSIEGSAVVLRSGESAEKSTAVGDAFHSGDTIKVGAQSRVGLQFEDGGFVRLGSKATLTFTGSDQQTKVDIAQGNAYFFSRSPKQYPEITTPTVSAAMRGTEFSVISGNAETTVAVLEGSVELRNDHGSALLGKGEGARVKKGEAPTKQLIIDLPDTVQWIVQVPFIGSWSDYQFTGQDARFAAVLDAVRTQSQIPTRGLPTWMAAFARAAARVQEQRFADALGELGQSPAEEELRLLGGRTALTTGDFERGKPLLESLLKSPHAEIAESARSSLALLALSNGDAAQAHTIIAPHSDSSNYSTLFVHSLIAQAERDIPRAVEFLDRAMSKYPDAVNLKTRKAELALAAGEIDVADEYIAASLASDDSGHARAIAGFISLAKGDRAGAAENFAQARTSSSSAPLAFLGSGLLESVEGNQASGIEFFQRAVLLDPKNSMLRSYLGKSFSEATKEGAAESEYAQAIELDPKDPTPWIYRSYSRIAQNRPVEALSDIEESIARNNNRAIFRSSFLLDQDSAVRSANLARVFNELGFTDAGRIEAIKSINKQYSNFSAHRLLAETQDTIFLADASLSERRISDLMAPLSLNLFDSVSGNVTLNEYSALFERDQTRFAYGGDFTSFDDLYAPALLAAGKDGKLGYSFSAGSVNRDGSAQGNSNQDYRIGGMLQYQPTWRDRISLSTTGQYVRTRDSNAFEQDVDLRRFGVALGALHTFEPGVVGIFSSSLQRSFDNGSQFGAQEDILSTQIFEGQSDSLPATALIDRSRDSFLTSVQNQAQVIVDGQWLSSVVGASIINVTSDRFDDPQVIDDSLGELTGKGVRLPNSEENSLTSHSLYAYETAHMTEWLHLTGGMAYETVEQERAEIPPFVQGTQEKHRLSPKFGLVANPIDNLTVRSTYSEGLRKSVLEDQISIEPTMVGGINQRFNDLSGTQNRQYGVGLDWKIPQSTYTGIEWSRRHIIEPISFATNEFIVDFDTDMTSNAVTYDGTNFYHGEQDFVRAYFSQVLATRWVGTIDSRYSKQRFTDPDSFERIEDNRNTATVKYFDPSGLILFSRALWRHQNDIGSIDFSNPSESFWHFDVGAGYRLQGRKGIIRLELRNLLDKSYQLNQTTGFDDILSPSRAVYLTARFNY